MQPTNTATELAIDETGECARYALDTGRRRETQTVSLHLDSDGAASYRLEFGEPDRDGTIHWFDITDDYEYPDTTSVDDTWRQTESYFRIMITSAAPSGTTATAAVSTGR